MSTDTSKIVSMPEFQEEFLLLEAQERICEMMADKGVDKEWLAERLNCCVNDVRDLLDEGKDLTLAKLASIAFLLDCRIGITYSKVR